MSRRPSAAQFLSQPVCTKTSLCTGFPWWLRQWRICLQYRRPGFNPWIEKISWRRKWQPTPVFLPGESHGQRSLVGLSPWGHSQTQQSNWRFQDIFTNGIPSSYCYQQHTSNHNFLCWPALFSCSSEGHIIPYGIISISSILIIQNIYKTKPVVLCYQSVQPALTPINSIFLVPRVPHLLESFLHSTNIYCATLRV